MREIEKKRKNQPHISRYDVEAKELSQKKKEKTNIK